MLENDATEIPTRISTGFPSERKKKNENDRNKFTFYNRHLESTEFRLKILLCTTRGLQHAQATF